jgi:hypothetical protein
MEAILLIGIDNGGIDLLLSNWIYRIELNEVQESVVLIP